MKKETYERMRLVITEFDTEDVITTSGPGGGGDNPGGDNPGGGSGGFVRPTFVPDVYEMPVGM